VITRLQIELTELQDNTPAGVDRELAVGVVAVFIVRTAIIVNAAVIRSAAALLTDAPDLIADNNVIRPVQRVDPYTVRGDQPRIVFARK